MRERKASENSVRESKYSVAVEGQEVRVNCFWH